MAATFPLPAAASDLNCFMIVKLLLKELVEMLGGPLARTEADAPSHAAPTSVNDNMRESPPSVTDLLKRTLSPLVRPTRVGQTLLRVLPEFAPFHCGLVASSRIFRGPGLLLGATCEI